MAKADKSSLKNILEPNSVAVVGASTTPMKIGNSMVWNLANLYEGKIFPVNPKVKGEKIYGCEVYASVSEIPGEVDLACLVVPRELVPESLEDCGSKGVKGAMVAAAGFSDSGEEGKRLEKEMLNLARKYNIRIIGPNSQGILNMAKKLDTAFAFHKDIVPGGVAIVSQTGTFIACAKYYSQLVGGVSHIIDLANMCDIDFSDTLEYLENDKATKVIALHIEGMREGKRFMDTAKEVSKKKPIVVLKSGRSEIGSKAVQAHTGALAGRNEINEAAFKQAGLIQARDIDEWTDIAKGFNILPPLYGNRVVILTFTGGIGALLVDACEEFGLELTELSPETLNTIRKNSADWLKVQNPVDMFTACQNLGMIPAYNLFLESIVKNDSVDCIILIIPHFPGYVEPRDAFNNIKTNKPIIVTGTTAAMDDAVIEWTKSAQELEKRGIAVYPTPRRDARVLAALYNYYKKINVK
ncbi:MAG: acetate--CoA ligase family protein [Candidatus Jordarchaeum sp.]|uniref:acetate--CoA ligase family protein n=1 Tax=Candidatus Jordarchaeum sp. TaxID=2823881 RepID=UPI004049662B